ncbi:27969_t:CDS:1, partial [Racocetra persica]
SNEREKIIINTPSDYVNLFEKCWSSEPDLRPILDDVLPELVRLSKERPIKFITNIIGDKRITESLSKTLENLNSSSDSGRQCIFRENVPSISENVNTSIHTGNLVLSNDNENI